MRGEEEQRGRGGDDFGRAGHFVSRHSRRTNGLGNARMCGKRGTRTLLVVDEASLDYVL